MDQANSRFFSIQKPASIMYFNEFDDTDYNFDDLLSWVESDIKIPPLEFEKLYISHLPMDAQKDALYFLPAAFDSIVDFPDDSHFLIDRVIDFGKSCYKIHACKPINLAYYAEVWHCFRRLADKIELLLSLLGEDGKFCVQISEDTERSVDVIGAIVALILKCDEWPLLQYLVDPMLLHVISHDENNVCLNSIASSLLPGALQKIHSPLFRDLIHGQLKPGEKFW